MKLTKYLVKFEKNNSLLLLNSATVSPILIEKGKKYILDLLKNVNQIKDKKLLDFLSYHKIIVEDDDREDYRIKTVNAGCVNKRSGVSFYLLLSQGCNLGCVYCYNGEKTYGVSKKLMMKEEVAYKGIDKIARSLASGKELTIVFLGGEPLLNWGLAKKVIIYCEQKIKKEFPKLEIKYHLTSNLSLLPSDLIEWAKKYHITFLCDIDGDRKIHNLTRPYKNGNGSYDKITANIKKLIKAGIKIALRSTVTSYNMNSIKKISKHHKDIGASNSAFVAVNAITSDEDILPKSFLPDPDVVSNGLRELAESNIWDKKNIFPLNEYLERIRRRERNMWCCGAPLGNTPVLDVNGDIYACLYLVGMKKYRLGNIFSEAEYPKKEVVAMMMDVINIDNSEECKNCKLRYLCGGGCPVGRLIIKGNPKADEEIIKYTKDITCKVNKAMIEEALWHYAKKIKEKPCSIKR
ncbi:MAG: radical SAM protein [Planctomycetota bacterium]